MHELIDRPLYASTAVGGMQQLLIIFFGLQLPKVKYCYHVAHEPMYNNYLFNHIAYYHMFQQVIAFLVMNGNDSFKGFNTF